MDLPECKTVLAMTDQINRAGAVTALGMGLGCLMILQCVADPS